MPRIPIALVVPAAAASLTGGGAYVRRMAEALRVAGHACELVELPWPCQAVADRRQRDAARALWPTLPAGARLVIDGAVLPAFAELANELGAVRAVGLIHRWSADPGEDERRLPALLAGLIVPGEAVAERLATLGIARDRIAIVAPGVADYPRSDGSGGPHCAILAVGPLVARQGHDVLLEALARLPDLDWRLTIAGSERRDPAHARALRQRADQPDLAGRVVFATDDDQALAARWRGADLFALATHWEAHGATVAEALRRGLPVAVTAGGSAAALVPPEGGVVCPPGDVEGLSKALRRVIFDVPLRRAMAAAAWQAGRALPDWPTQAAAFAEALGPPGE